MFPSLIQFWNSRRVLDWSDSQSTWQQTGQIRMRKCASNCFLFVMRMRSGITGDGHPSRIPNHNKAKSFNRDAFDVQFSPRSVHPSVQTASAVLDPCPGAPTRPWAIHPPTHSTGHPSPGFWRQSGLSRGPSHADRVWWGGLPARRPRARVPVGVVRQPFRGR